MIDQNTIHSAPSSSLLTSIGQRCRLSKHDDRSSPPSLKALVGAPCGVAHRANEVAIQTFYAAIVPVMRGFGAGDGSTLPPHCLHPLFRAPPGTAARRQSCPARFARTAPRARAGSGDPAICSVACGRSQHGLAGPIALIVAMPMRPTGFMNQELFDSLDMPHSRNGLSGRLF